MHKSYIPHEKLQKMLWRVQNEDKYRGLREIHKDIIEAKDGVRCEILAKGLSESQKKEIEECARSRNRVKRSVKQIYLDDK